MELQQLFEHPYGLWAVAPFFQARLQELQERGSPDIRAECEPLVRDLRALPHDGDRQPEHEPLLRQSLDRVFYLLQFHDPAALNFKGFRRWLEQSADLRLRIFYALAMVDLILEDFNWSVTTEVQELRSLRKGLAANWSMLQDMQEQSRQGDPEEAAYLGPIEETLRVMLSRTGTLLRNYI